MGSQNIHCIGDRANKVVIDIFEDVLSSKGLGVDEWRPRIEHAQIMRMEDLERVGRVGSEFPTFFRPSEGLQCPNWG